ncbi:ESX secretion-associated protein EspG [Mycolicibacterium aichiense]|uniref:DNA-binding protein n=1 Tax=Mycolicibacterium aichiense TaxID=1799 RepID=A0AAD1HSY5_9MYCO|nr:ESX secretion-associated protein EspG [Mycolicibacterium aichiense]MCV7017151.1 ESX secretion-associated protein EspG [Mycolicibacterium aichiense]BBX10421.1 DNA-binding protein [Mycolicibacterium aichiense]STZ25921.1 DNA-binding protein [Mycolicibacterium aichiense]
MAAPNAVELTADAAWCVAESVGAGSFPWVLAITPAVADQREAPAILARLRAELTRARVMREDGTVAPAVARWTRTVCAPDRWLELRYVRGTGAEMLRGLVARRGDHTVVALRSAELVTLTELDISDPLALALVVAAGLADRSPARFAEFTLPTRTGVRADEKLRGGADLDRVLDNLGIPGSAVPVVRSVFTGPRSYVEIRAGSAHDGVHRLSEVGVGIVDSDAGRVLVNPERAADGEWLSTFSPGSPFAIALALDRLTATLPDGRWYPSATLTRDFTTN